MNDELPRTLLLSFSALGGYSATGQLMQNLFAALPRGNLLQICWEDTAVGIRSIDALTTSKLAVFEAIKAFQPEVIYLRLTDRHVRYARLCVDVCDSTNLPVVLHCMDDWPSRAWEHPNGAELVNIYERFLKRADRLLTISPRMASVYLHRYGRASSVIANGIEPSEWNKPRAVAHQPFIVRYCGALANDMQRQSVIEFGRAVETLSSSKDIRLEIYSHDWSINEMPFQDSSRVKVSGQVPSDIYPTLLSEADVLLVAYNFDRRSRQYTGLSFANKVPEYLASGRPIVAFGPREVPTIDYLAKHNLAEIVDVQGEKALHKVLAELQDLGPHRVWGLRRNRSHAFQCFDINKTRVAFEHHLRCTAQSENLMSLKTFSREDDVAVDETAVVHQFFRTRTPGQSGFMLDVGAHHGSACRPFLREGWTVHAFEPDPKNFSYLVEHVPQDDNFVLNQLAVGDESGKTLSFYASEQSTGISSLIPFHEGHKEVARVSTTRLDEYLKSHSISQVDFLKIDTEGFDLRVLEGFPWDRIRPRVIECEFEDAKTERIGYNLHDQARFLADRGYEVFVSEWHPIIRYGIKHQWKALKPYPTTELDDRAWGNFLAFRDPITAREVEDLFLDVLKRSDPDKNYIASRSTQGAISKDNEAQRSGPATSRESESSALNSPRPLPIAIGPSNMLTNHLRIFSSFIGSRTGLLVGIGAALTLFAAILAPDLIGGGTLIIGQWIGWLTATVGLIHLFGYMLERARFERTRDTDVEDRLAVVFKEISELKRSTDIEDRLAAVVKETKELKQKTDVEDRLAAVVKELSEVKREIASLNAQLPEQIEQVRDLKDRLDNLYDQNMDIKRKLPELVEMIYQIRESDT